MRMIPRVPAGFVGRHSTSIRVFVVVVLFALLSRSVEYDRILDAFRRVRPFYLVTAAVLMIPNLSLQVLKWHFILRTLSPRPSLKSAALTVFGGFFIGAATPARTGEFARGVFLPEHPFLKLASLTILDKGFNQATVVFFGLISLGMMLPRPLSLVPLGVDILFVAALLNFHRLRPLLFRALHRFIRSERLDHALAAFDALSPGTFFGMAWYSAAFYLVYVSQFYILLLGFIHVPFGIAARVLPVVYLVNLVLPVSFGDFGVKETAAVNLFAFYGIPGERVFTAALLSNVMTFLLPGVAGGVITLAFRRGRRREDGSSDSRTVRRSGK